MLSKLSGWDDTIAAIATPPGVGAIAVIRISGVKAISIANRLFPSKNLASQKTHTLHFGEIKTGGTAIDEVLLSIFKAPRSYTGEDIVEISCHGSAYVQQEILNACINEGARLAKPGEFTQRAFLNGKMDLSQAEAVADLIAADTRAAQQVALNQLRGGFSGDLNQLRAQLIDFAALLELELDFSEEDVQFADRTALQLLIDRLITETNALIASFSLGNVIKKGVSVAIIGKPNAGKSTLLNALLNEERAIVSEIAGTTRDTIEETLNINGILFRLIDTAGIREHTADKIESLGIERSKHNAEKADIILLLQDATQEGTPYEGIEWLNEFSDKTILVHTKVDKCQEVTQVEGDISNEELFSTKVAAKNGTGIDALKNKIFDKAVGEGVNTEHTIVTNARHQQALVKVAESMNAVDAGLKSGISSDLLMIDIRRALHYLGEITGQVEIDRDILGTIFGKFCIGK